MSNLDQESNQSELAKTQQNTIQSQTDGNHEDNQNPQFSSTIEFINKINENQDEHQDENQVEHKDEHQDGHQDDNKGEHQDENQIEHQKQQDLIEEQLSQNIIIVKKEDINNNNNLIKKKNEDNKESKKTKLENKFSFWYRIDDIIQYQLQKQALDKKEYEVQVKKIAEFDTVEDFWGIFQHLRKPDSCKAGIEYFMFKEPIKPMWEDENNKNGGRISIKLKKDYTTIIWEEMIFVLIGGILPKQMKEEINGIVVTSRKEYNTLQIWFKNYDNDIIDDLQQCIRDVLVIPPEVNLEIKQFYKNNNKKDYNNNNKKSGGYYNNKGYNNNNYYGDNNYDYYNKEKKNKHLNHKK